MNQKRKQAYLIMAHTNFEQLKLLIAALDFRLTDIFIHIDKNSDYNDFESLKRIPKYSYIEVFKEFRVFWADFSQTECELFLLDKARNHDTYEYYHLISNADFPTMSQKDIYKIFHENLGKEFVSFRFPMNIWPFNNKPYTTEIKYFHVLSRYYRTRSKLVNKIVYCTEYFCVFLQFLLRIDRIKNQYIPAKGSNWFSITDNFASYILSKKEWIYKNYHMTRSSEEVFPAVLVYNSEFRKNLYDQNYDCSNNANQRYIDWERGFPYTFRVEDYDEIINSGLPFVRKTDMRIDGGLVQKLYDKIMAESQAE